jgi:hypothetical protein
MSRSRKGGTHLPLAVVLDRWAAGAAEEEASAALLGKLYAEPAEIEV